MACLAVCKSHDSARLHERALPSMGMRMRRGRDRVLLGWRAEPERAMQWLSRRETA